MGTTAEKLQNIINAKTDIGAAITEKGGTVPPKLIDYGKAIRALPAGAPAEWGAPADPELVYKATRISGYPNEDGWMPMPEPGEREIYFLFLIPADGIAAIALKSTTTDETYEIAVGHTATGSFTVKDAYTVAKGATWEAALSATDFPGHEYFTGTTQDPRQVMIRLKCSSNMGDCSVEKHPDNEGNNCNIVEIRGNCGNSGRMIMVGDSTNPNNPLQKLVYFSMVGQLNATLAHFFSGCTSLLCVVAMQQINKTATNTSAFNGCSSLVAYPWKDIQQSGGNAVTLRSRGTAVFNGCSSLAGVYSDRWNNGNRRYKDCISLQIVRGISFPSANRVGFFEGAINLTWLEDIVPPSNVNYPADDPCLHDLPRLCRFTFAPKADPMSSNFPLNISNCAFTRAGLVECFSTLPTIDESHTGTISVYGNPGAAELTAEDIAIATAKRWTVVTTEPTTTEEEGS